MVTKLHATKKSRVKGDMSKPTALLKLMELVGPAEAKRLIGVTPQTMYRARDAGVVSKVVEVAAQGALDRRMAAQGAPQAARQQDASHVDDEEIGILILELPLKYEARVTAIAEKLGAKVVR